MQEEIQNPSQLQSEAQVPQKKKTAAWIIFLFLAFFPPVAFYLLWRDRSYLWFVTLSRLFGATLVLFSLFFGFFILPKIDLVLRQFSPKAIETNATGLIWLTIILGIGQFAFGFFLKEELKKDRKKLKIYFSVCLIFLILDYVLPFLIYLKTITPLYDSIL